MLRKKGDERDGEDVRLMWKRREIGKEKCIHVGGSAMARAYVVNRAAISGEGTL